MSGIGYFIPTTPMPETDSHESEYESHASSATGVQSMPGNFNSPIYPTMHGAKPFSLQSCPASKMSPVQHAPAPETDQLAKIVSA